MNEQTQDLKNTPLHIAAKHGHFLIVKYLLENGAIPNITNREGLTAFEFADQSKRQIEMGLLQQKSKGIKSDLTKVGHTLENLDSIKKLLVTSQ